MRIQTRSRFYRKASWIRERTQVECATTWDLIRGSLMPLCGSSIHSNMTSIMMAGTFKGNPVHQVNTKAWHKVLKRLGIENFRWHDSRHTWASWHIQEGTPLHVLQELGGWSTPDMVQKYAHLSSEHLAQWVDRRPTVVPEIEPKVTTFLATEKENGLSISAYPIDLLVRPERFERPTPWFVACHNFSTSIYINRLPTSITSSMPISAYICGKSRAKVAQEKFLIRPFA